jgi:hypothetical protein
VHQGNVFCAQPPPTHPFKTLLLVVLSVPGVPSYCLHAAALLAGTPPPPRRAPRGAGASIHSSSKSTRYYHYKSSTSAHLLVGL